MQCVTVLAYGLVNVYHIREGVPAERVSFEYVGARDVDRPVLRQNIVSVHCSHRYWEPRTSLNNPSRLEDPGLQIDGLATGPLRPVV